ncbi:MAG TPA: metallophosphoesterase [Sporichthyaceae bacterium]|nr:metallophosphoesterase [Sporichthyaceae bacterium]
MVGLGNSDRWRRRPPNPPGSTPDVGVPPELAANLSVAEQHEWIAQFLRSRVVTRRAALRGAAGALAGLGLAFALDGGRPAGAVRYLPTSGPTPSPTPSFSPTPISGPLTFLGRRVSFGNDPGSSMAMAAELTAPPPRRVLVDVGLDTDYGQTLVAEIRHLVSLVPQEGGSIRAAEQWFLHGLATDLRPGQRYHYRFRLGDGITSPDAVFRTAPAGRGSFTFTAFGDHGVDDGPGPPWGPSDDFYWPGQRRADRPAAALTDLIVDREPAFHLLAGDICYAATGRGGPVRNNGPLGPPDTGFENFDPLTWTRYFTAVERSAATTPWMFATGNHDVEALYDDNQGAGATHGYGGHRARLDLPTNGPSGCPSVYSFRYGNVGFLSVDSNDLCSESMANHGYSQGAQTDWVRDTLAAMRADKAVEFIVVFFHHCAYATLAGPASDEGVRTALAPLFERYSVDLAVQGHNHAWERTNPIRGGRSTTDAPTGSTVHPVEHGTTYICAGTGGRPSGGWQPGETDRYPGWPGPDNGEVIHTTLTTSGGGREPETVDWSQARYEGYALLEVEVVPGAPGGESTMTVRTITDQGVLIDVITLARLVESNSPHPVDHSARSAEPGPAADV